MRAARGARRVGGQREAARVAPRGALCAEGARGAWAAEARGSVGRAALPQASCALLMPSGRAKRGVR